MSSAYLIANLRVCLWFILGVIPQLRDRVPGIFSSVDLGSALAGCDCCQRALTVVNCVNQTRGAVLGPFALSDLRFRGRSRLLAALHLGRRVGLATVVSAIVIETAFAADDCSLLVFNRASIDDTPPSSSFTIYNNKVLKQLLNIRIKH